MVFHENTPMFHTFNAYKLDCSLKVHVTADTAKIKAIVLYT